MSFSTQTTEKETSPELLTTSNGTNGTHGSNGHSVEPVVVAPGVVAPVINRDRVISISAKNLAKMYTISHSSGGRATSAAEAIVNKIRNPMAKAETEAFWAVKDVSFDVYRGDVVGVIGRNGAGKSTLLKLLSRITEPTKGSATLHGRVGSLLEVGTGFHPELTGRENIYLNGAILGMLSKEIDRQFDDIVEFSGTEKFLDTPVKRYSSGMYVRLAFAVAAHLNPEILIVDEVLAVGDAEFQRKCLGKMQDVARGGGRTVLFVSHNMQAVSLLCNRIIYLRDGKVFYDGPVEQGIKHYLDSYSQITEQDANPNRRPGRGDARFAGIYSKEDTYQSDEVKTFDWEINKVRGMLDGYWVSAHIVDERGIIVVQCDSRLVDYRLPDNDNIRGQFQIDSPWLKPGQYRLDAFICAHGTGIIDQYEGACVFNVSPVLPYPQTASDESIVAGQVLADFKWVSE